jgi:hypothetical protein
MRRLASVFWLGALLFVGPTFGDDKGPVGDAWSDARNPVVARFKGQRLDLWSLRPPRRSSLPAVSTPAPVRNPIDRFILSQLEAKRLTPSPEADRKTLIRRLAFGLTGLPPTPQEVEKFLSDPRPDAYERLVDRLLASRHFGEQWGRHWLDVVRYSDTMGFERDELRPTAWRYRDYVIAAFNKDKPYDQFLREQLAGDELAGDRSDVAAEEMRIATGYLRVGPWDSTKDTNLDSPVLQRDEMLTDLVNTTASGFLGLTFTCCKCHDHKYDPFLQADHYRLRAYFAAVEFTDYPLTHTDQGRAQVQSQISRLDAELGPLTKEQAELESAAVQRLGARRLAFAQAVLPLLEQSPFALAKEAYKPVLQEMLKRSLQIKVSDAIAGLPEKEKRHYEKVKADVGQARARKDLWHALGIQENPGKVPPTRILRQGDFRRPTDEVQPGIPALFNPAMAAVTPKGNSTGRRSALAEWIASCQNPWTARVMVNRIWQHHFGVGLVATPDDFGYSGARPSNQPLLDWLAVEFMDSGWSMKHIQRLIVTSATYRQSSAIDAQKKAIDPDNTLLWRQNVQRLDAESLRDALLAVSGRLQPTCGGPAHWPPVPEELIQANPNIDEETDRPQGYYAERDAETDVRSVFLVRKRSIPSPFLQAFNQPDPACTCGRRDVSIVAPQALMLMNDPFGVRMARALADRLLRECGDEQEQVERLFRLTLSRQPTEDEKSLVLRELSRLRSVHAQRADARRAALADVCQALVNTNEFIFVD